MERDVVEPKDRIRDEDAKGRADGRALDLRGLKCPLPALRTEKALGRCEPGAELLVLADDPLARLDIAHLCREGGHELRAVEDLPDGGWRFRIRCARASGARTRATTG
jgi:tRNA 2-thiouridine synthesizing protein A